MSDLIWHTEKVKVSELKLLQNNPRTITAENFEKLEKDIEQVGNFKPLICDIDKTILGGNQRSRVLIKKDAVVEISIPNRALTKEERKKIIILDNQHRGDFDLDILANEYEEVLKDLNINIFPSIDLNQLEREEKNNSFKILVTVKTAEDQENIKAEIEEILKNYEGSYLSLNGGEL